MQVHGLSRVPYYPELSCLNRPGIPGDCSAQVLSLLLYWHSLDDHKPFSLRHHTWIMASILRVTPECISEVLHYLKGLGVLGNGHRVYWDPGAGPAERHKPEELFELDFENLAARLKEHGLLIPVRVLKMAADDRFDFYVYLNPARLPDTQGIRGRLAGVAYAKAAECCARILCGICAAPEYRDFVVKALAPGWRLLAQPPAQPEDVLRRWQREGEQAVDLELADGVLFVPEAGRAGTALKYYTRHSTRAPEPRTLAATLYLSMAASAPGVHFFSDLSPEELRPAYELLRRFAAIEIEPEGEGASKTVPGVLRTDTP